ncbi:MAG TPA: hypothetical protein VER03_03660 [Bryobacteraceae bacterium]|nr:hypothetical protein [Bryobacteraceae bacterium]
MSGTLIHCGGPVQQQRDRHIWDLRQTSVEGLKDLLILSSALPSLLKQNAAQLTAKEGDHMKAVGRLYRSAWEEPEERFVDESGGLQTFADRFLDPGSSTGKIFSPRRPCDLRSVARRTEDPARKR